MFMLTVLEEDSESSRAVPLLGTVSENLKTIGSQRRPSVFPLRNDKEEPFVEEPLAVVGLVFREVHLLEE